MKVYVHLSHGQSADAWHAKWKSGSLPGLNGPYPYGYHMAEQFGANVVFSKSHREGPIARFLRLSIGYVLDFDLVHAFRNRRTMNKADVIWTHTESQYAAVLFLKTAKLLNLRTPIIAQTVWLFDRWYSLPALKRYLLTNLIRRADIVTFHSAKQLETFKRLFPQVPGELVRFGICLEPSEAIEVLAKPPRKAGDQSHLNVLCVGNDRDRDWDAVVGALGGDERFQVRIASSRYRRNDQNQNVSVALFSGVAETLEAYAWADCVVVVTKPNTHASGITVVLEAVLLGVPVVASRGGGIEEYFSEEEVHLLSPEEVPSLAEAIIALDNDATRRSSMIKAAARRRATEGYDCASYVKRHVEISSRLLSAHAPANGRSDA